MTFHEVKLDANGNPLYELDMVEFEGKWYVIEKRKGDYVLVNDDTQIQLMRVPSSALFLVEHFF